MCNRGFSAWAAKTSTRLGLGQGHPLRQRRTGPGPEGQRMPHWALRFGEDHRLHPLEEARRTCVRPRWRACALLRGYSRRASRRSVMMDYQSLSP